MAASRSIGLSGIVLYAKDVSRLVAFYTEAVGLEFVERDESYVVLSDGRCDLSIVAVPRDLAAAIEISDPPAIREATPVKPTFRVRSLEAAAGSAAAHGGGAKPLSSAWTFRGERHLDGFDPEGNVVQFVQREDD